MAQEKIITLSRLTEYDTKIKDYLATEDAKSIHTILYDSTNKAIKFYKKENATLSDTADYTIEIPAGLDGSATIASALNGVVTLKAGITETDGIVANNSDSDITLAKVATTGAAEDISYDNTTSGLTADDVQEAIDELAQASAGGVSSKTVYITETAGGASDAFSKRYGVYQGATGSTSSPVVGEKLVDIDIPKDMVVESGSVVDIVFVSADDTLHEGNAEGPDVTTAIKGSSTPTAADAGKYIKLTIANATSSTIYIKVTDLVDIYTVEQNATQIQLAIDSNNEISATVVAGSIGSTELATDAVITAKIADDAVTADKVAISAHTESQTASTDGLAISVTTTDGQVSAVSGSIAANTYDAYGAAAAAVEALDSNTSSATNTTDSGLTVLTEVGIADGLISTKKSHTFGSAADCADTDFLKTEDYTTATTADINALFTTGTSEG